MLPKSDTVFISIKAHIFQLSVTIAVLVSTALWCEGAPAPQPLLGTGFFVNLAGWAAVAAAIPLTKGQNCSPPPHLMTPKESEFFFFSRLYDFSSAHEAG
jgi:hypothetical protein